MDKDTKTDIYWKLDYEGGYEYLVYGNSFAGEDAEFDTLVADLSRVYKALNMFFAEVDTNNPPGDED